MTQRFTAPSTMLAMALLLAACGGGNNGAQSEEAAFEEQDVTEEIQPPTTDEPPPLGGISAPEALSADRESSQATTCPAVSYRAPLVAAWDMSRDTSTERQKLLARFGLSVVNMPLDPARTSAFVQGVKSINSGAALAQYLNFPDLRPNPASGDYGHALASEATARGWWLKSSSGGTISWTSGSTHALNPTSWTTANGSGQRYPQYKAAYDHKLYFASTALDYVFTGNTWAQPRVDADWRRNGTTQLRSDPTIQGAMRAGHAAYWASLRALKPSIRIMGGLDNSNDLSSAEYVGQLDGAFLDGMIGKSWSLETRLGWSGAMAQYRTAMANTRTDKKVVFVAYGASPVDYATMRYGLASALMDNGLFLFIPSSGSQVPAWYDEYAAPLGKPVDAPPTSATQNGIYMRRFENGLVLVNPSKTSSASINVGSGYQRLSGSQEPAVNNGAVQSTVTLGPRQGLVMLKVQDCSDTVEPTPTTPSTGHATPRVATLDYSKDTTAARRDLLSKFKFVILSFSKTMGDTKLQEVATTLKAKNPNIKVAQYVLVNEAKCDQTDPAQDTYAVTNEIHRNNWWLRNEAGQRVQWTTLYDACEVNFSSYAPRNASGQTYAQYRWSHDYNAMFKDASLVDYVFIDNFWHLTRNDADWKRIGVDLPKGGTEASAIFRKGMASYVANVRATAPRLKVMGNINHDLNFTEYQNVLDGAFMEGLIGKSWSRETWAGWDEMMKMYRGALQRTRTRSDVFLNTFANPTDYRTIRYGLASALLDNGYFLHIPLSGMMQPNWVDDYGAPIGDAAEAPPTGPAQNGIWMRRYSNGLVLVNPSKTVTASISIGPGYKRLTGTQDPAVNNGRAESTVTLGPRQGLLMVKQ
jgi:hypothetical protein